MTMPAGREGELYAKLRQRSTDPTIRRIECGKGNAGDGGRQGERQIDHRIQQSPRGESIAGEHPGNDQSEHRVDGGGDQGRPKA
jgi:hypothetical protein